ncbi:MAG: hypothetical protein A2289_01920 [Deltaproteobacteria bacterium RIFOXYA12_FULL_58_15]|nr:MAG: hypothetical protein A2289_01920 [Deltaproteobacteria bacterium RIFOXYA12_FULL_58_15]OGR14614.1 MAG: hypothetical protein A2341_07585 [Deltaproteobacteria bacterium RIFOXYB12_FULL_58_9]
MTTAYTEDNPPPPGDEDAPGGSVGPTDTLTETRLAELLVSEYGADLRYCSEARQWLVWDGRRFAPDDGAAVQQLAKATVRDLYPKAARLPDAQRIALTKAAIGAETKRKRDAMVGLAQSEPAVRIRAAELDSNRWFLNVANGTIDLTTGSLNAHRRADLNSKYAPVAYHHDADCPTWRAFLARVFADDQDLIAFVARSVGYSLTGDVGEQVLFFLHGQGANGKSTLTGTLLALTGDYGKQSAPDLLLAKRGEAHPTEQADLAGARLVVTQEVEAGRYLAETTVKQLTGGDRIKARFMGKDFFEFSPTHKLWLCANHKPIVRGTDNAIWRRLMLVPFNVTIPEQERDPDLPQKLRAELPGILRWAVLGCLDWQRQGLQPPDAVRAASAEYRNDQDTIGHFLDERCTLTVDARETAKDLYADFKQWCEANGERVPSPKVFGANLGDRSRLLKGKIDGRVVWRGIRLRVPGEPCQVDGVDDQSTFEAPTPCTHLVSEGREKGCNGLHGPQEARSKGLFPAGDGYCREPGEEG